MVGVTELAGATGVINATTNGSINFTEAIGTGVMRVGDIESTGSNITLNVPGTPVPGDDLLVVPGGTLSAPVGSITMYVGGNVTVSATSLVSAPQGIVTIYGDDGNADPASAP